MHVTVYISQLQGLILPCHNLSVQENTGHSETSSCIYFVTTSPSNKKKNTKEKNITNISPHISIIKWFHELSTNHNGFSVPAGGNETHPWLLYSAFLHEQVPGLNNISNYTSINGSFLFWHSINFNWLFQHVNIYVKVYVRGIIFSFFVL